LVFSYLDDKLKYRCCKSMVRAQKDRDRKRDELYRLTFKSRFIVLLYNKYPNYKEHNHLIDILRGFLL
jgi:hypothetical protein